MRLDQKLKKSASNILSASRVDFRLLVLFLSLFLVRLGLSSCFAVLTNLGFFKYLKIWRNGDVGKPRLVLQLKFVLSRGS